MENNLRAELEVMAATWPAIIPASALSGLLGGLYGKRTLSNMRWAKTGPVARKIRGRVFHLKIDILRWLEAEMKPFDPENIAA